MEQTLQNCLRDKAWARWLALILIASMMFFAYMFVDVMSPLKSLLETSRGWDSGVFGTYAAGEYILNVFGFLIIAGIILDKMGVRFTGTLSASLMVIGACIKYIGISDWFQTTAFCEWLGTWWTSMPGSAKMAAFGFMIFGCGCEMAGTTVSKAIAKWFKGKEMALAMGLEMAIARLGVFAVMWIAPLISNQFSQSIVAPLAFCTCLLLIGLINYLVFCVMDTRLDKQLIACGEMSDEASTEDEFHMSDLGQIFTSKMFWLVALLCVLYYSAIFPFQRYAPNYLETTLGVDNGTAAHLFSFFPILAMALTPLLGALLDFKGKGASMLMLGAVIMVVCHLCFAFVLPIYPQKWLAVLLILILGVSFSLVPAALWPSVPKIIDEKVLGSAYCLIFWVQNIGLCLVPMLIGKVLEATGGYEKPMIIFSSFGVLAFIFSLLLKVEDKKKGYGLELPNKQ
ncbi:MAG: MFS transporter [Paludibacter sp.]|nr:MFS transporter [Bacteroidales bacterium]MCM1069760.1 MFS transporter [Prevotella sp.]MCM1354445.1 MFS transporter [Bacteroides sp.]MCM1443217.1 MFS transporter [Muribaculum sp.]MCM1482479.1 MFS transporter [Paludibacter sp.]